jgi:hypothetical protein
MPCRSPARSTAVTTETPLSSRPSSDASAGDPDHRRTSETAHAAVSRAASPGGSSAPRTCGHRAPSARAVLHPGRTGRPVTRLEVAAQAQIREGTLKDEHLLPEVVRERPFGDVSAPGAKVRILVTASLSLSLARICSRAPRCAGSSRCAGSVDRPELELRLKASCTSSRIPRTISGELIQFGDECLVTEVAVRVRSLDHEQGARIEELVLLMRPANSEPMMSRRSEGSAPAPHSRRRAIGCSAPHRRG